RVLLLAEKRGDGIVVKQMTLGPGLRFEPLPLEPMKSYRQDEKRGYITFRFDEDRVVWRDSSALFRVHKSGYRPPQAMDSLAYLELVNDLPSDGETAIGRWNTLLHQSALTSLERVIEGVENGPRGYKSAVQARQHLKSGLAKVLPTLATVAG